MNFAVTLLSKKVTNNAKKIIGKFFDKCAFSINLKGKSMHSLFLSNL